MLRETLRGHMTLAPQITFRNMEPIPDLEAAVLKEITGLERFFNGILSCQVVVEGPRGRRYGGLFHVRIDLKVPNEELVIEHTPSLHNTLQEEEAIRKTKQDEPRRELRDAHRAVHDAFHEMRRRLQDYVHRVRRQTKQHERETRAKVTKLFPDHGFLETLDGREIYFHRDAVLDDHFDRLRIGTDVQFAEESGEKGAQASTVKLIHPTKQARAAAETEVLPNIRPMRPKAG